MGREREEEEEEKEGEEEDKEEEAREGPNDSFDAAVQPQQGPGVPERWVRRRRWETDDITPQRTVKLCSVYCKYKQVFIFSF